MINKELIIMEEIKIIKNSPEIISDSIVPVRADKKSNSLLCVVNFGDSPQKNHYKLTSLF